MSQSLINNVVKSVVLLGVMLACQSSFAGVGIFMNATNNTPETFSVSSCEPGFVCGDDDETVTLSSGETAAKISYHEATYSYWDTSFSISIPIYIKTKVNVCNVTFSGTTYYAKGGSRMKDADVAVSNIANEYNYACDATLLKPDFAFNGDTEYFSVTINPIFTPLNPALEPLNPAWAPLEPALAPLDPAIAHLNPPLYDSEVPGCNILPPLDEQHETIVPPGKYCPLTVTISNFTGENNSICMKGLTTNIDTVTFYAKDMSEQNTHGVSTRFLGTEWHDDLMNAYGFSTKNTIKMWKCY